MPYFLLIFIFLYLCMPFSAKAQNADNNIDRRVSSAIFPAGQVTQRADEPLLTGREDLILYNKRKLFRAYIAPAYQYTNNAFLSDQNRQPDHIGYLTAGLNFSTVLAQRLAVSLELQSMNAQYMSNETLNYNSFRAIASASYDYKGWLISFSYAPTVVFDDEYDQKLITLYPFSGFLSRPFTLPKNLVLTPFYITQMAAADPEAFSYFTQGGGAHISYPYRNDLILSATASYQHKEYFDYFAGLTGQDRTDESYSLALDVSWQINKVAALTGSLSFIKNDSTLEGNDFKAVNVSPGIRLAISL
jgi:hypothetical protein